MIQKNLLKILFVEDLPSDVDLAVIALRKEKLNFDYTTVCTRNDMVQALKKFKPDLIISDYMMPAFNGLQALKEAISFDSNIPFILLTGSVNEETAVECIKAGAQDYVIKEHMTRLPIAVREALAQVDINNEKRAQELLLRENEMKLQSIFSAAPVGIGLVVNRILYEMNDSFCSMTGYSRKELIGKSSEILYSTPGEFIISGNEEYRQISEKGTGTVETKFKCKDGKILNVILSSTPLYKNDHSKGITFTVLDITERKKSEEALRDSEHLFQTLSQVSPVGIFRTKPDGYTTYVNPKWLELAGLTFEEAVGFGWLKAVHPEDRKNVERKWDANVQSQLSSVAEYRFQRPDKSFIWVIGNAVPEMIDNEIVGYIGTITDITERKLAEDELRNSEERLKILFDHAPDAYYLYDLLGNFVDGNIACEKLTGYNKEELIGKNFLKVDLISFNYLPLTALLLARNFLGQGTGPNVLVLNRKDRSLVTIEIITHPVKIKDKTLVLGIARDITERKLADKALRESEEKYRGIFENVQDVYYETLLNGTILEVSPSITILSKGQYQMQDLIGKSMFSIYSDPQTRQDILTALQNKGAVTDFEVTLKNNDGSPVPCSISAKLIFDASGKPVKIIGSLHDITDRKNITEALKLGKEKAEASDKLKTSFLNNISHEVRTPLNGILGFAEIISLQDLSEAEKKESIAMLYESSNRLLNTITNYMDISLITSGSLSVNKRDFIPVVMLKKIFNNFEHSCLNKRLELFLDIPEQSENYFINSDPEICQKIISHLLDNSVKFTEKGNIHFGYTRKVEQLEFFVKDTGIGINLGSFNIIFDRFVKEAQGPYKVTEGSGLGLSIAKGMSDAIGSKIKLESEPGVGSCFFLTIPIDKDAKISYPITSGRNLRKTIAGSTILIAEDDETNFYYLNALITREIDAKILHASNGQEAIELFNANPDIKLILMDIKMPVIDGFEATRQIKLISQNVHIIAITAYAMSGDEERIMAAGCDGYLSKPINKKSLLEKIAEFISIK
jgi:hypothetical protein